MSREITSRNISASRHVMSARAASSPPIYTQSHLALAVACSQQMPILFEFSDKDSQSNAKLGSGDQLSHEALYRHMFLWITNYILYLSTLPATARAIILVKYPSDSILLVKYHSIDQICRAIILVKYPSHSILLVKNHSTHQICPEGKESNAQLVR